MIFVDRLAYKAPQFLLSDEVKAVKQRMVDLLSTSSEEHLDQLRVSFESDIWHRARDPLKELFRNKCAFCESWLASQSGDVEHYRPRQGAASDVRQTGHLFYSWLAYDWDNLLIICSECNRVRSNSKAASGEFQVMKKRATLLSSVAECRRQEKPYLLDPCFDDPSEHLECDSVGKLRALTARGDYTISVFDLNGREGLLSQRQQALEIATAKIQAALDAAKVVSSPANVRRVAHDLEAVFEPNQPHLISRRAALREMATGLLERQDPGFELLRPILTSADLAKLGSQTSFIEAVPVHQTKTRWGRFRGKRDLPLFAQNRITGISIRNFKGIEALDLEVPDGPDGPGGIPGALTLLGENAAGKSSVLEAVALASLGTNQIACLNLDGQAFLRREASEGAERLHVAEVSVRMDDGVSGTSANWRGRAIFWQRANCYSLAWLRPAPLFRPASQCQAVLGTLVPGQIHVRPNGYASQSVKVDAELLSAAFQPRCARASDTSGIARTSNSSPRHSSGARPQRHFV